MKSALTTVLITLLTLVTVQTSSGNYKKVGDTVVLSPDSVSAPITSITWKHNSNLTVEWNGGEIDFYPKFKDRCKLNTTTGELIISGLTLEDSGSYTAEINNRVMNTTEITVISVVPPPTVSTACDHEMTYCVLTCDVNTTDPEPLTYYWILDGRAVWYEEKSLNLTKEESSMHLISCAVENPVSSESSKEVLNPFITSSNYKKVGDTVVLSPGSVSAPITSITWRHNSNLAVEWYGDEIYVYPKFKGRCSLNTTTGELIISGLTLEDSGSYTAEINNRVLNTTEITVISEVPTPTISQSCDAEKTHCIFTCEGITTDAEPVVYFWILYDMIFYDVTKELRITKETIENSISCGVENPVSSKWSDKVPNPFIINYNYQSLMLSAGVVLILLSVVGVANLVLYEHKCEEKKESLLPVTSVSHRASASESAVGINQITEWSFMAAAKD